MPAANPANNAPLAWSGLVWSDVAQVGGAHDPLPAALLAEWVAGHLGGPDDVTLASRVARVVVCGNSRVAVADHHLAAAKLSKEALERIHGPMNDLDALLSQMAAAAPVDVMPGATDPSGHWLPQQPMPACVLPQASRFSTLRRCANPHECSVGGARFLGSSGQPLDDLRKFTAKPPAAAAGEAMATDEGAGAGAASAAATPEDEAREVLGWLEAMLRWRHLAPTAPDTLDTYPALAADPFVVEDTPHVFFAGNQPAFGWRKVAVPAEAGAAGPGAVLCVSVPSFAKTVRAGAPGAPRPHNTTSKPSCASLFLAALCLATLWRCAPLRPGAFPNTLGGGWCFSYSSSSAGSRALQCSLTWPPSTPLPSPSRGSKTAGPTQRNLRWLTERTNHRSLSISVMLWELQHPELAVACYCGVLGELLICPWGCALTTWLFSCFCEEYTQPQAHPPL